MRFPISARFALSVVAWTLFFSPAYSQVGNIESMKKAFNDVDSRRRALNVGTEKAKSADRSEEHT